MAVPDAHDGEVGPEDPESTRSRVSALECSPERTVFTEEGNDDAWISTDTTVELDP